MELLEDIAERFFQTLTANFDNDLPVAIWVESGKIKAGFGSPEAKKQIKNLARSWGIKVHLQPI